MAAAKKQYPLSIVLSAIDKATAPITRVQRAIDKTFAPLRTLQSRFDVFGKAAGLDRIAAGFGTVLSRIGDVGRAASGLALRLGGIATAGAALGFVLIRRFAASGDEIAKTSKFLGIGVQALQEYRYAASLSGVEQAAFDKGLKDLGIRAALTAAGVQNEGAIAFKALGINVRDASGKVRSLESILPELEDALAGVTDESTRNAIASRLFGVRGAELVKVLAEGSKKVDALRERYRTLGAVWTKEGTASAEAFQDTVEEVGISLSGIGIKIAEIVLPKLNDLFGALRDWIVSVQPRVQEFTKRFMEKLPEHLATVRAWFMRVREALQPLIDRFSKLVERMGWVNVAFKVVKVVAIGIVAALGAPLIAALTSAAAAVVGLGAVLLSTPFGVVAAAITALVASAWWLYENWDLVVDKLRPVWETLKAIWDATGGRIAREIDAIAEKLRSLSPSVRLPQGAQITETSGRVSDLVRELTAQPSRAQIDVNFRNVPEGVEVSAPRGNADLNLNVGLALAY